MAPYGGNPTSSLTLQDGPLVLEPGPVFARDGDRNRSEQISYRILRGLNSTTHKHKPPVRNDRFIIETTASGDMSAIFIIFVPRGPFYHFQEMREMFSRSMRTLETSQ